LFRPPPPPGAMTVWLVAQLVTTPYTMVMSGRVLRSTRLALVRAGLPALGIAVAAVGAALLVPWLVGAPEGRLTLIAARVAAGASICLPGLAWCLARLGLFNRVRGAMRRRPNVAALDSEVH
jgi:hypothetical protein